MHEQPSHIRHGVGTVRPYLYGPKDFPEFLETVFGAVELERHEFSPHSFHIEMQVGDSVVVIEAGELPAGVKPWKNSVYVYVEDVDAVFTRAVDLGATVLSSPADKSYQERQAGFVDAAGNTWWIATCKATRGEYGLFGFKPLWPTRFFCVSSQTGPWPDRDGETLRFERRV